MLTGAVVRDKLRERMMKAALKGPGVP